MKKKELLVLAAILFVSLPLILGSGGPPPERAKEEAYPSLIDNFEDGDITTDPAWWKFDNIELVVDKSFKLKGGDSVVEGETGEYAVSIGGSTTNWYVGGFGSYIAKDASGYNAISMDVYGAGKGSGKIKIELYEDDNNNMQIEQDPKTFAPLKDDRFVYEVDVNWTGWKRIKIPLKSFVDDNRGVGDDTWNPDTLQGSGGLLHIQFIIIAADETGSVNMAIDNVELTN